MEKKENINPERGLDEYGNVKFADEVNKKYPIDTPKHIRAAWSYIHMPRNYDKYTPQDRDLIEKHIINAWKEKINLEGPPEAKNEEL